MNAGAKRKLDESTATDENAKAAEEKAKQNEVESLAKDAGVESEDVCAAGTEEVGKEDAGEERARKKSKTGAVEDEESIDE